MPLPSFDGSERLCITAIRPITAPTMPSVGAYVPRLSKTLAPCRSNSSRLCSSTSRTCRIVSGSAPSTSSCMPLRRNSSVSCSRIGSSASSPSRRAIWLHSRIFFNTRSPSASGGENTQRRMLKPCRKAGSRTCTSTAPNVPTITIRKAAAFHRAAMPLPFSTLPPTMATRPSTTPMMLRMSMAILRPRRRPAVSAAARASCRRPRRSMDRDARPRRKQRADVDDQRDAAVARDRRAGEAGQGAQLRAERLDHDVLLAEQLVDEEHGAADAGARDDRILHAPAAARRRAYPSLEVEKRQHLAAQRKHLPAVEHARVARSEIQNLLDDRQRQREHLIRHDDHQRGKDRERQRQPDQEFRADALLGANLDGAVHAADHALH